MHKCKKNILLLNKECDMRENPGVDGADVAPFVSGPCDPRLGQASLQDGHNYVI